MSERISQRLTYRRVLLQMVDALITQPDSNTFGRCLNELQPLVVDERGRKLLIRVALLILPRLTEEVEIRALSDIIIALADLKDVQAPLWRLITSPIVNDATKDFAHLILQSLGDTTPLAVWLNHLQEPKSMLERETFRLLDTHHPNPETVVDCLDFFMALPFEEQKTLLESLQIHSTNRLQLFHTLQVLDLCQLPLETAQLVHLHVSRCLENQPNPSCLRLPYNTPHVLAQTEPDTCYSSLPDGLGYQVVIVVRRHLDSSAYCVVAAVIHDKKGITGCFGFHSLSGQDFWKLLDKIYEGCHKYPIPAALARTWLLTARRQGLTTNQPLPYEFSAWQSVLLDIPDWPGMSLLPEWHQSTWQEQTGELLDHPDLQTWAPDWTNINSLSHLGHPSTDRQADPSCINEALLRLQTLPHIAFSLKHRLERAAWLFHMQQAYTYRDLAATASLTLLSDCYKPAESLENNSFLKRYLQRGLHKRHSYPLEVGGIER